MTKGYGPKVWNSVRGYWTPDYIRVWEETNNMEVPKGYCIHHINQNKLDNRIENLQLMTQTEHKIWHGLHQDPEKIERMRESALRNAQDPEYIKHVSEGLKRAHEEDPTWAENISIANKKLWADPEYQERQRQSRTGHPVSEETKEKIRQGNLGKKRGPMSEEDKLKRSLSQKGKKKPPRSPEHQQKINEAIKESWRKRREDK